MKVWFTADLHLGHGNIIKYCQRPFLSAQERERARSDSRGKWRISDETIRAHDDALLDAINSRIEPEDVLWLLGDFCWGGLDVATAYRERIRCRHVHLVWGNHDHHSIRPLFDRAIDMGMIKVEGVDVWLCHYPMRTWDKRFHGSWHVYGHVHGRLMGEDARHTSMLTRDVGVDACNYQPISFEELREYMKPRVQRFLLQKEAMLRGEDEGIV